MILGVADSAGVSMTSRIDSVMAGAEDCILKRVPVAMDPRYPSRKQKVSGTFREVGKLLTICDVIVMELRVQLGGLSDFIYPLDRAGVLPVDERDRDTVGVGEDGPGSGVTVADDRAWSGLPGEPRLPDHVVGSAEGLGGIMC